MVPITLEFADPENGNARFFDFSVNGILDTHIKDALPSLQYNVLQFLCGIKFVPTCSIGNGISWLELYALFLVHTEQTQPPTTAKAGASLTKRLRDFTSQVRSVVRGFLADEEKVHFKPSLKRESRLQKLGFQNHMPAMRFLPVVTHATGEALAKALLSLTGHFTKLHSKSHAQGLLPLKMKRVKLRPAPKWHRWLACVRADFHHVTDHLSQLKKKDLVTEEMKHDAFWHFQCPACDYARNANATMFQLNSLAKPLWCGACQVSRPTKQWSCECGGPWYLCPRHGKPLVKETKQIKEIHPKPKFMDDTTEHLLLLKLDSVKCTPKILPSNHQAATDGSDITTRI